MVARVLAADRVHEPVAVGEQEPGHVLAGELRDLRHRLLRVVRLLDYPVELFA